MWRKDSDSNRLKKSQTIQVISAPGLENNSEIASELQSQESAKIIRGLDKVLALTKWTANRFTKDKKQVDESWRIFYIEQGNRDLVSQAGLAKHITPLLQNTDSTIQMKTLECLSNLARESDDIRAAFLLRTKVIQFLGSGEYVEKTLQQSQNNNNNNNNNNNKPSFPKNTNNKIIATSLPQILPKSSRFYTASILNGLLGASNVGKEAAQIVKENNIHVKLMEVLMNQSTDAETQIEIVYVIEKLTRSGVMDVSVQRDKEWLSSALRVSVSLCQSVSPPLQYICLRTILALVRDPTFALMTVEEEIHPLLSVMLHSRNPAVFKSKHSGSQMDNGFLVCKVAAITCLNDAAYTKLMVKYSSVMEEVLIFLRSSLDVNMLTQHQTFPWELEINDAISVCQNRTSNVAMRCCGAAWILSLIVLSSEIPSVRSKLKANKVSSIIKSCASSSDAFTYQFAARALGELELFEEIPFFRTDQSSTPIAALSKEPSTWNEQDVLTWVSSQKFSVYEPHFKSSWIDGELLLALNDQELAEIGVSNPLHRKHILRAISQIQTNGKDKTAISKPLQGKEYKYDVFISYRRSTGAELAQLLKMHLERMGFSVFLDIDCLGQGDFLEHIFRSLENSQHFIAILTNGEPGKSVGYFDRCQGDVNLQDNVHKEIAHAVNFKKNVVPVFVAGYKWPAMEDLPEVCRHITTHNAVEWIPQYYLAALEKLKSFLQ